MMSHAIDRGAVLDTELDRLEEVYKNALHALYKHYQDEGIPLSHGYRDKRNTITSDYWAQRKELEGQFADVIESE